MTVIVTSSPGARVPTGHTTVASATVQATPPGMLVADTKVTPAGRLSVTRTPVATDGPLLRTWMVHCASVPATTVPGPSLTTDTSAAASTSVVAVSVLLSVDGSSGVAAVTEALLVSGPVTEPGETVPVTVTTKVAPGVRVLAVHETLLPTVAAQVAPGVVWRRSRR